MKLLFLGTGHGVPTVDRFCSATLLECGGWYYLIDAGAPVGQLFIRYGIPYEKLRAVFLTHRHSDHTFGLPHLVNLSSWYYRNSNYDVFMPEQQSVDALRTYLLSADETFADDRIRLQTFKEGEVYRDENVVVTAIATDHMNGVHPSYAFMIEGEEKRLFFTGDMHCGSPDDFPQLAKELPSELIVSEFVHFREDTLLPHLRECKTKQVLFNHYNENWTPPIVAAMNSGEDALRIPVRIVTDGETIEI